jgi:hypothetical protein
MPYSMVGENPIEFYYPDGYGELNIVEQDETKQPLPFGQIRNMVWVSPQILNSTYNETSPPRPIYEGQKILRGGSIPYASFGCETNIRIRASYQSYRNLPPKTGGQIKYAIIDGVFPPSLTLDIDTGIMFGEMDDLDTIYAEKYGKPTLPPDKEENLKAASLFNYNFGEQGPKRYTEDNYGKSGSETLHADGFPTPQDVTFVARAFNASNPIGEYIDGRFTIQLSNNWSIDRDKFILNIRNQFFIDGKPVTNKEYLSVMKSRGYFPSCS